jgi:nucleotide-binding universal stress UspA family protein
MLDNKSSILVPYDGTELSIKALEKAEELGQKFSCQIIVSPKLYRRQECKSIFTYVSS